MNAPPVLLLSRSAISKLATTRDYLAAMQTAFADLAEGRFEVPAVAHVPGVGGMFHIKSAQRAGSPTLAAIKVNGNFPNNGVERHLPTIQGFVALLDAESRLRSVPDGFDRDHSASHGGRNRARCEIPGKAGVTDARDGRLRCAGALSRRGAARCRADRGHRVL